MKRSQLKTLVKEIVKTVQHESTLKVGDFALTTGRGDFNGPNGIMSIANLLVKIVGKRGKNYLVKLRGSNSPLEVSPEQLLKTYNKLDRFEESLVNEAMSPKFWWLSPDAKMHPVAAYEHWNWAMNYLTSKEHYDKEEVKDDVYGAMVKLGWSRVSAFTYEGKRALEYDCSKHRPLSPRQMKELKDTAIEEGANEIIRHAYDIGQDAGYTP